MNGLAEVVQEFQGRDAGTSILIIGGTHGNEKTGVLCVEALKEKFLANPTHLLKGVLRVAVGNPLAVERGTRNSEDGHDLNKSFTEEILSSRGSDLNYETRRAQQLAVYIRQSDIVIDIHSTQRSTATSFISSKIDADHKEIYQWFAPLADVVIQDPNYIFAGEVASIDEYADLCGGRGVCLESGFAGDTSKVEQVLGCIYALLAYHGMIENTVPSAPGRIQSTYHWEECIPYDPAEGWEWSSDINIRSFEFIPKGTVIGYAGKKSLTRDYDAYLLFPKTEELMKTEGRVTYLARKLAMTE